MAEAANEVQIYGVPPHAILPVWRAHARDVLKPAVKPESGFDLDSVLMRLLTGQWHLWVVDDYKAVAIVEVVQRPLNKVLWIWFLAGRDMPDWWEELDKQVTIAAQRSGCVAIESFARVGWHKHQRKQWPEYKHVASIFRKKVN